MKLFKTFLQEKLSLETARMHAENAKLFLVYLENQSLDIQYCNSILIHDYLLTCRNNGWKASTIKLHLSSIRYYLDFQNVQPNPTLAVRLEKRQKTVPHGLWSVEEIKKMYQEYPEKYPRNKVLLGLLSFQALRTGETLKLGIQDISFEKQQIFIHSSRRCNARTLQVPAIQMELLKAFCKDKKRLIFDVSQFHCAIVGVAYHLKKEGYKFGTHRLRASVYTNWLKKYNLRQVQYMAGHRYVSSTERYQTQHLEDLQIQLEKYYPLQDD